MQRYAAILALFAIQAHAQSMVLTHRLDVGYQCDDKATCTVLRATTEDGKFATTTIDEHGALVFHTGASTVDFAPQATTDHAGTLAGYVVIRIGGQPYLMPVYNLPASVAEEAKR